MKQKILKFLTNKAFIANITVVLIFAAAALTLPVLLKTDKISADGDKNQNTVPDAQTTDKEQKEWKLLHEPEKSQSLPVEKTNRILHAAANKTQTHTTYWVLTITDGETEILSYAEIYENKTNIAITVTKNENGFNGIFQITKQGILISPPTDSGFEYAAGIYWAVITYDGLSCEITNSW